MVSAGVRRQMATIFITGLYLQAATKPVRAPPPTPDNSFCHRSACIKCWESKRTQASLLKIVVPGVSLSEPDVVNYFFFFTLIPLHVSYKGGNEENFQRICVLFSLNGSQGHLPLTVL